MFIRSNLSWGAAAALLLGGGAVVVLQYFWSAGDPPAVGVATTLAQMNVTSVQFATNITVR